MPDHCAACGLPPHRYGRNEGMDRYDPMACINQLRGELADLLDGPLRVIGEGRVRDLKTWDLLRRIDALTNDSTSQTEEVIAKIDKFRKELRAAFGVEDPTP